MTGATLEHAAGETESIKVIVAKYEGPDYNKHTTYNFNVLNELGIGSGFGYNSLDELGGALRNLVKLGKRHIEFVPFDKDNLGTFVVIPNPKELLISDMAHVKKILAGK